MADIEQLSRALLAADKAGDTQSAQLLANEIRKLQGSQQQPAPTQANTEVDTSLSGAVSYGVDQAGAMVGKGIQSAGELTGVESVENYGQEMAQRNEAEMAASNYQRPEGADGIISNLREGDLANAGKSLAYGVAEAAPQVAGGAAASIGAGLAATTAPVVGTGLALAGTAYGVTNALGANRAEKEEQGLDPTATATDLASAVASGLVELTPLKGGGATLKFLREGVQEGVQEGLVIGGTAVQGGEYVPQEVLERMGDAALIGGTASKGISTVVNTVSKTGEVIFKPKEDLDPETTQAASDVSALLQRVADENGYNLKDIDSSSKKGANQTLEGARDVLLKDLEAQVISLTEKGQIKALSPEDKAFFKQAIRQSKGKVGTTVTKENFDFMQDRFGNTSEGQALLNTFRRSNVLTEVYAGGLKGGVSKFTDMFNPLPSIGRAYNPAGMVAGNINTGAALATGGQSLAAQIPLVVGGRAIDAVTGRRSKVNRFIKKNRGVDGLADPTAPAARDLKQEAKDRRAAEAALKKQQAEQAKLRLQAQYAQQYANGDTPSPDSPNGKMHEGYREINKAAGREAQFQTQKIEAEINAALDAIEAKAQQAGKQDILDDIAEFRSSRQSGRPTRSGVLTSVIGKVKTELADVYANDPQPPQPATPAEPQLPIERQLGKNSNQAYLATLRDKMDNDTTILAEDRATLGDAFDSMALNLGRDPIASLEAIVSRATSNLMKPKLAETYLTPYMERVKQQQKAKDAPSQPEPSDPTGNPEPVGAAPVEPTPTPPAGPVLQPAPAKPKPTPKPPSPKQVKKAQPEANDIIEIGKKGSKYEFGIKDWDMALEAAKKLGLVVNMFSSNRAMGTAAKSEFGKVSQSTRGFFHPKGSKGGAGGTIFGIQPGGSFKGKKVTTTEALTTLLHEIAHGVTLGPIDGKTSELFMSPQLERTSNKLAKLSKDIYKPGSFVGSAIVPLLSGPDFDINHPVIKEINNLQRNVSVTLGSGSGGSKSVRQFNLMTGLEHTPEAKRYTKYANNFAEFAVDPVWVYMFDPALAKQVMPETTALIRKEFAKAGNKQIQFYSHPFATILAVVSAMGLLAAGSEEDEEPMMAPGILSA